MRIITDDPSGSSGKLKLLGEYSERMFAGDAQAVLDHFSDDFHSNVTPRVTPEAVGTDIRGEEQEYWRNAQAAFPDMTFDVNLLVEADDLVISNWTIRGTHTGAAFYDLEPTGESVEINGTAVLRFRDGKVVEHWGGPHCQKGLGLLPDPFVTVALGDPAAFVGGVPHDELAELRRHEPVSWQRLGDGSGFWAVLRHADVVQVAHEPAVFSAGRGGVVLEDLDPDSLEMMRGMLLAMDPPRHATYRRPIAESFKASVIGGLETQIRGICGELMAEAAQRRDVEFVHDVTAGLPTRVMGRLMGLPEADWAHLHDLAERQTSGQDPDLIAPGEPPDYSASIEMAMYAIEFATARRADAAAGAEPPADLTTLILEGDFGGERMTEFDFGSFFVQLVTAGNDTTKTMLSSGLLALLTHPEQMEELRRDPALVAGAVEEILRWANPLHYFRRTAAVDATIGGVAVAEGDKVAMYYTAANRDEAVFDDPQRFDIRRHPNPHLSFGIAEHFCLGVHLARLEGRVFFEELLATFDRVELTGDPVRLRSNLNNGLKRLPVRLG